MRRGWLAAVAVLAALVLLSCFDEAMGPAPLAGRFALSPHFASPHAGIVPINRFRLILRRLSNDSVALDTVVAIAPGDTAVDLSFTVPMFTSADQFVLFLRLITPEGDTAFTAGPDIVAPSTGGIPPEVPVDLDYIGPGSNAAGVRILTLDPMVFFGQSVPVTAEAFDSADNAIPGTPIGWSSLDTLKALVPDPAQGQVVGAAQRGTAPIVATLLTGPADTIGVLVQPLPVRVSIDSGNGQTAAVGTALATPIVALVKAADSLGVAGAVVRFTVAAGTLTADSAVTNASGHASVGWTLATTAGLYALTAKVTGIPDSLATATATALSTDASPGASVVTVSSGTVTAGSAVTLTLQAKDAQGNPLTGDGLTVVFTAVGGTSTGTISATTDHGDGTYTARFTGAKAGAPTTIGATIDGEPVTTPLPTVTVTPAAATKMGFAVEPPSTVAGAFLSPAVVVRALDPFDNVDPAFTGTITIALDANPGPGTLFGTLSDPAEAGAADFDDLMIDTEGVGYTLVAASSPLTPATSAAFNISTPTPATVVWVNLAGGNWNNPANWVADPASSQLNRVPTAGDTVFISQAGTYTVTLDVDARVAFLFVGGGVPGQFQTLAIGPIGNPILTHDSIAAFAGGESSGMGVLALSGGTISSADTIEIIGGAFNWTGGTLTGGGALQSIFGTISLAGGPKTLANYSLENFSSATWSAGNVTASSGGTIQNELGGTLSVSGSVTLVNGGGTPSPAFVNEGTIDIQGGTIFSVGTAFTHADFAVLQGNGTLDIETAASVVFDGDVNPGTSPGILNVTGDLPQSSTSALNMELNGPSPGTGHDQLNVSGAATLDGGLNLTTGFAPTLGASFRVLAFASHTGQFAGVTGLDDLYPITGTGIALDTAWASTALDVRADGQITFSADSFFGQPGPGRGLFRTNASTTFRENVGEQGAFYDAYPRWSPDRKRMTHTANDLLHIIDAAPAGVPYHLVNDTLSRRARYSPDGVHLAFECGGFSQGGVLDVCTIADVTNPFDGMGDGTGKVFVTDAVDSRLGGPPAFAWNPTKPNQLAVVRDESINGALTSRIYLVNYDGTGATPVSTLPIARRVVETMDWSPDGTMLAFGVRNDSTGDQQIWTLTVAGGVLDTVSAPGGARDFQPAFSPDGREILFQRDRGGCTDAIGYVITSASTGVERVELPTTVYCEGATDAAHDWSPDGRQIVLVDGSLSDPNKVYVVPRDVTATNYLSVRRLVGRPGGTQDVNDKHPSWRP